MIETTTLYETVFLDSHSGMNIGGIGYGNYHTY